jgi:uncharacterized protein DUF262
VRRIDQRHPARQESTMPRLTHRSLNAHNRQLRGLVHELISGELAVDTPYQRKSVWETHQRIMMIKSLLTGVPLPAIILNDRNSVAWRRANGDAPAGEPVSVVIDGKQRLETARLWSEGLLFVPAEWFDEHEIESARLSDVRMRGTVRYRDLTLTAQRQLDQLMLIPVAEANVTSVREEAEVYVLVNSAGTQQSPTDILRARRVAEQ